MVFYKQPATKFVWLDFKDVIQMSEIRRDYSIRKEGTPTQEASGLRILNDL